MGIDGERKYTEKDKKCIEVKNCGRIELGAMIGDVKIVFNAIYFDEISVVPPKQKPNDLVKNKDQKNSIC